MAPHREDRLVLVDDLGDPHDPGRRPVVTMIREPQDAPVRAITIVPQITAQYSAFCV